jgi:phenylacetate-CoA ligase
MKPSLTNGLTQWMLSSVVAPLWAWHERSPYLSIAAQRAREERFSLDERLQRQWIRLKDILDYARTHNAFYRRRFGEAGFEPGDMKSWDDLKGLPVLTKAEIREAGLGMVSQNFRPENLRRKRTSGSTGMTLDLFADENCMQERRGLTLYRDRWAGWNVGELKAMVWGNPPEIRTPRQRLRRALLERDFYLDTLSLSDPEIEAFARTVLTRRPTLLFGHAHSLYLFARFWREWKLPDYRFKGVISSAMVLHDYERRGIEAVFGPVFDRYGCEEVSLIASECEAHEGLHINTDSVLVELHEEKGEDLPGKVIVTDLLNRGMPFIRYEVGDRAVALDRSCSCGRTYPLLGRVAGRVADYLIAPDGRRISGISLTENFATLIPGVDQVQLIQDRRDHIVVKLVPAPEFGDQSRTEIARMIRDLFGTEMKHTLVKVSRISPEPSGKYRFSTCLIDQPSPQPATPPGSRST